MLLLIKSTSFFISKKEIDGLLEKVKIFSSTQSFTSKNTITFRSDELPQFETHDVVPQELPEEVYLYFGEPIAISEFDVFACLKKQSNDNVLIIGGEPDVAQKIAINTPVSIMAAHTDKSAKLYFFNFMRQQMLYIQFLLQYYDTPVFEASY